MTRFDQLFQAARSRNIAPEEMPEQEQEISPQPDPLPETSPVQATEPVDQPIEPVVVKAVEPEVLAKHKNPDYVRTTIYIPKQIHRKLRSAAMEEDREMSEVVEILVREWLETRKHLDV